MFSIKDLFSFLPKKHKHVQCKIVSGQLTPFHCSSCRQTSCTRPRTTGRREAAHGGVYDVRFKGNSILTMRASQRVGGKWKNKKGISMWWGEQHEFRWYVGDCSSINSHARSQIAQAVDTCTCKPTCVSALACRRDSKSKPNPKKQEEEITQTNSTRTPNANHHVPRFRLSKVQHG